MSLEGVIIHIRIEEQTRKRDLGDKAKEIIFKSNVIESDIIKPRFRNKRHAHKSHKKNNLQEL